MHNQNQQQIYPNNQPEQSSSGPDPMCGQQLIQEYSPKVPQIQMNQPMNYTPEPMVGGSNPIMVDSYGQQMVAVPVVSQPVITPVIMVPPQNQFNPPSRPTEPKFEGNRDIKAHGTLIRNERYPTEFRCPECNYQGKTLTEMRTGDTTCLMCILLGVFTCCCCVAFCGDWAMDIIHICPWCKRSMGRVPPTWRKGRY